MRIELPDDYVPPQPTHPTYGYLTPEELEEFETRERIRVGIVPSVEEGELGEPEAQEPSGAVAARAPRSSWSSSHEGRHRMPEVVRDEVVRDEVVASPEQVVEAPGYASGGWLPSEPGAHGSPGSAGPEPLASLEQTEPPKLPETPSTVLGQVTDYTWDAYRQEWVSRTANRVATTPAGGGRQVVVEEPNVDVAAAAGGRGATSSWTSADGQTYRWDARAQRWIVEGPSS